MAIVAASLPRQSAATDRACGARDPREGRSMHQKARIALDAMGGDHGPSVVIPGAAIALERHPDSEYLLFGNEAELRPLLDAHPKLAAASRIIHTEVAIGMDDKPSQALRKGRWKS